MIPNSMYINKFSILLRIILISIELLRKTEIRLEMREGVTEELDWE